MFFQKAKIFFVSGLIMFVLLAVGCLNDEEQVEEQREDHFIEVENIKVNSKKLDEFNHRNLKNVLNESDAMDDLLSELRKIDKDLNPEYYRIMSNVSSEGNGVLMLRHYIDEKIRTSSVYVIRVEDNEVVMISDQSYEDYILRKEEDLIKKVEEFEEEIKIEEKVNEIKNDDVTIEEKYYRYDVEKDNLYFIIEYVIEFEDGTKDLDLQKTLID